ncbi:MAG: 1-acyl-sn-glycerol-3-phosphate acyltransferase [Gammaproteobacteria bacterium]|nr:1-acyl-sn-glycerol-3-phosphate acyltransferase [Gammaproteobacteria bacterium]
MFKLSLNHYWRIVAAGISYLVFAIGALIPGLYVLLLAVFPLDAQSKQARVRAVIQRLCRFYIKFMQCLGLIEYRVERRHKGILEGHLVIANHSMLIDALFVLAHVDNLCCVVKEQLCHNPFTRIPVRLAGYISNNADDFVDQAAARIKAGENVLIFPEGTRNSYDTQLDFKRGAANICVASGCPVLPIVIVATPRTVQKGESWYQLPSKKSRILIRINRALETENCIDTSLPRTVQYRRLTAFWRDYYLSEIVSIS